MKKLILASLLSILLLILILINIDVANKKKNKSPSNIENKTDNKALLISGENWAPYFYIENGIIKGINVDIYRYIFNKLDIEFELKIYPWSRVWKMIQLGQIDATDSTSHKKYREPYLDYTDEQKNYPEIIPENNLWISEYVFFVRNIYRELLPENFTLKELKDKGFRIGVIRDNSYFEEFWEINFELKKYADVEESFKALANGEIDLYPVDKTVGLFTLSRIGLDKDIGYHHQIVHSKPYYLLFVKNSSLKNIASIQSSFYRELVEFKKTKKYIEIYNKHVFSKID